MFWIFDVGYLMLPVSATDRLTRDVGCWMEVRRLETSPKTDYRSPITAHRLLITDNRLLPPPLQYHLHLALHILGKNSPVEQVHYAVRKFRVVHRVCYHNYGCALLVEFGKQVHHLKAVF